MKTAIEIQTYLLTKYGLKTSVRKLSGSMKGYSRIMPTKKGDFWPKLPREAQTEIKEALKGNFGSPQNPTFITNDDIAVFGLP